MARWIASRARSALPQVREDVLDGYVSAETALRDYGLVVTDRGALDHEPTARTRRARRG